MGAGNVGCPAASVINYAHCTPGIAESALVGTPLGSTKR